MCARRRRRASRRAARHRRLLENLSDFGLRTTLAPRTPPGRERSNGSGGGVCCGSVRSLAHFEESCREAGLGETRLVGAQSSVATFGVKAASGSSFPFAMKIKFNRLDHVQVCIPRGAESEAREFYGGLLGLEEIEKPLAVRANGGMW